MNSQAANPEPPGPPASSPFPVENRDLLYRQAVDLRFRSRFKEALGVLDQLQQVHPRYSRLYQERGRCYVALRDVPRAIEAFLQGVRINAALPASWEMLEQLYRTTGDTKNAAAAAEHITTLRNLPAPIVEAGSLFSDGELTGAENTIRAFLLRHGEHIEALRLLARIGIQRDAPDEAELLLETVLRIAPDYHAARADYALALYRRQKCAQSRAEMEKLLRLDPGNREYLKQYAASCVGLGDCEPIIALYDRLLTDMPQGCQDAADLHLWSAHALKTLGRQRESIEHYRAALAERPDFGEAWWSVANLKTYRFSTEEITRMRTSEGAPAIAVADRYHLCFALGKALEDRREYAQSWHFYQRGNALKHAEIRYLPEIAEINTRLSMKVCSREFFEARRDWGDPAPDPIFILGLPRSGSTLIEQILASHSRVEGTRELADIQRIVMELRGRTENFQHPRYPAALADLQCAEFRRLGARFVEDTRAYRLSGKPFFIDKMPNNFRYIGLIKLILPNAKIIDVRREPMACCLSNFKQLFSSGQEFSYDIEDIARHYRTYLELMAHWNSALPGWILKIQYEEVIDDLEGSVRRILDFCGLPFEPTCLEFHKATRSVHTASSEQVRQPIFRESLDQWRNFEPWLGQLKDALGDVTTHCRD